MASASVRGLGLLVGAAALALAGCGAAATGRAGCSTSADCVAPDGGTALCCGGSCVAADTDVANCGACGHACAAVAHGNSACVAGTCGVGACFTPWQQCEPGSGACDTDLSSSVAHCGGCGHACAVAGGKPACSDGKCGIAACDDGRADCNHVYDDGCEVDSATDDANCGGCGNACAAGTRCSAGKCIWAPIGVQTHVPLATIQGGWSACFSGAYTGAATIASVQAACTKARLLVGCYNPLSSGNALDVAAWAPRADVLMDTGLSSASCGAQTPPVHVANGVAWYFSPSYAWGFAPVEADPTEQVNLCSCDNLGADSTPGPDGDKRLCWQTSAASLAAGWRCGKVGRLDQANQYLRVIYQAD